MCKLLTKFNKLILTQLIFISAELHLFLLDMWRPIKRLPVSLMSDLLIHRTNLRLSNELSWILWRLRSTKASVKEKFRPKIIRLQGCEVVSMNAYHPCPFLWDCFPSSPRRICWSSRTCLLFCRFDLNSMGTMRSIHARGSVELLCSARSKLTCSLSIRTCSLGLLIIFFRADVQAFLNNQFSYVLLHGAGAHPSPVVHFWCAVSIKPKVVYDSSFENLVN